MNRPLFHPADIALAAAAQGAPALPRLMRGVTKRQVRNRNLVQMAVCLLVLEVLEVRGRELWRVGALFDPRRGERIDGTWGPQLRVARLQSPLRCAAAAKLTTNSDTYRITLEVALRALAIIERRNHV